MVCPAQITGLLRIYTYFKSDSRTVVLLKKNTTIMNKKNLLFFAFLAMGATSVAQQNTPWHPASQSNTVPAGFIGLGTKTTTTSVNTPLPSFNLHLHGTADYIESGNVSSMNPMDPPGTMVQGQNKSNTNWGVTTRIGLTNTMTGRSDMEGTVLQASRLDFYIKNQAYQGKMFLESDSDMSFRTSGIGFQLSQTTGRSWLGNGTNTPSSAAKFAKLNIRSIGTDNGLYIETQNSAAYGMNVLMFGANADAFAVWKEGFSNPDEKTFKVTGAGEVFARKYTTTLNNIPDYVFADDYNLMSLDQLRLYIMRERHLPNVPSAKEMEAAPVDLGELNRLLLEKVEELTLYVLELEERLDTLESTEK